MDEVADDRSIDLPIEHGLRWSAVRQVVTGLAGTLGVLAYARFLQPADLGAVGLALLVYRGLFLLVQAPIRDAVVYYRKERSGHDGHDSAAFWLLLGFSAVTTLAVLAGADLMGRFYDAPAAAALTRGVVVAFFFQAVAVVPAALLLRQFRFAFHEGLLTGLSLLTLLGWMVLAAAGWGPWSLVVPQVADALLWAAAVWIAARFRPALRVDRRAYRDVLRFSFRLFGSKLLVYLKKNLDNATVGRLGVEALGQYSFGEDQATFAAISVAVPVAQVTLAAMAVARERIEECRRLYLDMLRLAATLSTPMQVGGIVVADLGIALVFGAQWTGAVAVFRAYVALQLVQTLLEVADAAMSAVGRPGVRLAIELVQLPFFAVGIWIALQAGTGISGIAWSLAAVRGVSGLVYLAVTLRVLRTPAGAVLRCLGPSTIAGSLMGLFVLALRVAGPLQLPAGNPFLASTLYLLALVLAGAASYFGLLWAVDRTSFRTVMSLAARVLLPASVRTTLTQSRIRREPA